VTPTKREPLIVTADRPYEIVHGVGCAAADCPAVLEIHFVQHGPDPEGSSHQDIAGALTAVADRLGWQTIIDPDESSHDHLCPFHSLQAKLKSFGSRLFGRAALAEYLKGEDPAKALLAYMRTAVDAFLVDPGGPRNAVEGWEVFARWIKSHRETHDCDLIQPAELVLLHIAVHAEKCLYQRDLARPVTDLRVVEPWIDEFFAEDARVTQAAGRAEALASCAAVERTHQLDELMALRVEVAHLRSENAALHAMKENLTR